MNHKRKRIRFYSWSGYLHNPMFRVATQYSVNLIPGAQRFRKQTEHHRILDSLNGYDDAAYPYSDPVKTSLRNKRRNGTTT